jgi:hypothetical protein
MLWKIRMALLVVSCLLAICTLGAIVVDVWSKDNPLFIRLAFTAALPFVAGYGLMLVDIHKHTKPESK